MKSDYDQAMYSIFASFMRPFTIYVDAAVAVVNTNPNFAGMFGDASQQATGPTVTPMTPQSYLVSGCILYGNKQPWEFVEPGSRGNYQQNKVRESEGLCRIKTTPTGYNLLKQCEQVTVDGITFVNDSTPRPHGLVGAPSYYTFNLKVVDPS